MLYMLYWQFWEVYCTRRVIIKVDRTVFAREDIHYKDKVLDRYEVKEKVSVV